MPDFQALLDAVKAAVQAQFDSAVAVAFSQGVASVQVQPPVDVDAAVAAKVAEVKAKLLAGLDDEQIAEEAFKAIVAGL